MWARLYMLPVVQAEWDREWMKWRAEEISKEKEIMKNVEGWKAGESPYQNERWAPPAFDLNGNPVRMFSSYLSLSYNVVSYRCSAYSLGRLR